MAAVPLVLLPKMSLIEQAEVFCVDLQPKVVRTDAIQSFVKQETPILKIRCNDGSEGVGYSYTIGTGGSSVLALLRDHLLPKLMGMDADRIDAIWRELLFHTHATAVGPITSLALAALDTALWDRRCRLQGLPLWKVAGGAHAKVPVYTTEGGWLHLDDAEIVEQTLQAQAQGFGGAKFKVGKPRVSDDVRRAQRLRDAVGPGFELMCDANQAFHLGEARRRAQALAPFGLAWLEEPLLADDIDGHAQLCADAALPIAVGESLYSVGQFGDYLRRRACHIVQVDAARVGGITPWLKVAHLAECNNIAVCPHFLMELHVSLAAAVPNAVWVEYIPQLDVVTHSRMQLLDGCAVPPEAPGLGIDWNWDAVRQLTVTQFAVRQGDV